jgi:hypothetical protein
MRNGIFGILFACAAVVLAAGCGGGGGNTTTPTTAPTGTATPTYMPTGSPEQTVTVGASPDTASVANGSFGMYIQFPATTAGSANIAVVGSTSVPNVPAGITAFTASGTTLFYVALEPTATVTFATYPVFQLTLPSSIAPQNENFFAAVYTNDAAFPQGANAWDPQFLGAASDAGQVLTFSAPSSPPLTFTAGDYYVYAFYKVAP